VENMAEDPNVSQEVSQHPAWTRLNDQLDWYDKKSGDNQRRYKQIKVAQLVLAGSIPVFALVDAPWGRWITAILGASVVILEGFQQLGQYNNLWVTYRRAAQAREVPLLGEKRPVSWIRRAGGLEAIGRTGRGAGFHRTRQVGE
jgi:hypothetical protein